MQTRVFLKGRDVTGQRFGPEWLPGVGPGFGGFGGEFVGPNGDVGHGIAEVSGRAERAANGDLSAEQGLGFGDRFALFVEQAHGHELDSNLLADFVAFAERQFVVGDGLGHEFEFEVEHTEFGASVEVVEGQRFELEVEFVVTLEFEGRGVLKGNLCGDDEVSGACVAVKAELSGDFLRDARGDRASDGLLAFLCLGFVV